MSLEEKFQELKSKWEDETILSSDPRVYYENSHYKEIISIGKEVLPLIMKDLEENGGLWYEALRQISGEEPQIPKELAGRLREINKIWIGWAKEKGYI